MQIIREDKNTSLRPINYNNYIQRSKSHIILNNCIMHLINRFLGLSKPRINYIADINVMANMLIGITMGRNPLENNILPTPRITFTDP